MSSAHGVGQAICALGKRQIWATAWLAPGVGSQGAPLNQHTICMSLPPLGHLAKDIADGAFPDHGASLAAVSAPTQMDPDLEEETKERNAPSGFEATAPEASSRSI